MRQRWFTNKDRSAPSSIPIPYIAWSICILNRRSPKPSALPVDEAPAQRGVPPPVSKRPNHGARSTRSTGVLQAGRRNAEAIAVDGERTIHSHDVLLVHLLHGIEPLDPAHLSWQVHRAQATKRFREDLPAPTRTILLEKAKTDLRVSMDRIGRDWTLSDWVQTQLNFDLPTMYAIDSPTKCTRLLILRRMQKLLTDGSICSRFRSDRREGYRRCIDRHLGPLGAVAPPGRDAVHSQWLKVEEDCLHRLLPRHLGVPGTFAGLAAGCEQDLEAYAVTRLWHVALACARVWTTRSLRRIPTP